MYGLNGFALILFCALNVLAVRLCRRPERTRRRVLRRLCAALLTCSALRYGLPPLAGAALRVPVEFSAVAYFVVPAVLLAGRRRAESWAAYSGLMAGFFYYLCLIGAGGPVYGAAPPEEVYLSMACHGTLYVCGLVLIGTQCFPQTDGWKLLAGTALVGVRALLLRPLSGDAGTLFIYQLMDGALLRRLLPDALAAAALPAYYILLAALLCLSVRGFFRQNRIQRLRLGGAALPD